MLTIPTDPVPIVTGTGSLHPWVYWSSRAFASCMTAVPNPLLYPFWRTFPLKEADAWAIASPNPLLYPSWIAEFTFADSITGKRVKKRKNSVVKRTQANPSVLANEISLSVSRENIGKKIRYKHREYMHPERDSKSFSIPEMKNSWIIKNPSSSRVFREKYIRFLKMEASHSQQECYSEPRGGQEEESSDGSHYASEQRWQGAGS